MRGRTDSQWSAFWLNRGDVDIQKRRGGGTGFSPLLARNPDKIESEYSQMEAIQKQRLSCAFVVSNHGVLRVAVAGGVYRVRDGNVRDVVHV